MIYSLTLSNAPPIIIQQISQFLTQHQTVILSQVSQHLRGVVVSEDFWNMFDVNENIPHFLFFAEWLKTHHESLGIKNLLITFNGSVKLLDTLFETKGVFESLESLKINVDTPEEMKIGVLRLILSMTCNLRRLSTNIFTEDRQMSKKLSNLQTLQITDQSFIVNERHILEFPPVKSLLIRAYQVNFTALVKYIEQNKNIEELRLDCEDCQSQLFPKLISSINKQTILSLKLEHLENIDPESLIHFSEFSKLNKLGLLKTHSIPSVAWLDLAKLSSFTHLRYLNLTQAFHLQDQSLMCLIERNTDLKHVDLSWCYRVTSDSIRYLINKCQNIQELVLIGIKELNDSAFEPFIKLKNTFSLKEYARYKGMVARKQAVSEELKANCFTTPITNPNSLSKLKLLDCQSVNFVSDEILKTIGLLRNNSKVLNYYGEIMGVHDPELQNQ